MKHVDTIVLVSDIDRSKLFYTDIIGLKILHDWGNMIVFKDRFAIHQADALLPAEHSQKFIRPGRQGRNNLVIYFEAHDLEAEYQRLVQNKVSILHGIVELPWQKIFRVYDPDNHILEIGIPSGN